MARSKRYDRVKARIEARDARITRAQVQVEKLREERDKAHAAMVRATEALEIVAGRLAVALDRLDHEEEVDEPTATDEVMYTRI